MASTRTRSRTPRACASRPRRDHATEDQDDPARKCGSSSVWPHRVPHPLAVVASVLTMVALSFLGVGVQNSIRPMKPTDPDVRGGRLCDAESCVGDRRHRRRPIKHPPTVVRLSSGRAIREPRGFRTTAAFRAEVYLPATHTGANTPCSLGGRGFAPPRRAFDSDSLAEMFDPHLGQVPGDVGEVYLFEPPERNGVYRHGIDWAKEQDCTVIWTWRIDTYPCRLVAFERRQREPWPVMWDHAAARMRLYPGTTYHDKGGVGNPADDMIGGHGVRGVYLQGEERRQIWREYTTAIEGGEVKAPRIDWAYDEHRYCTVNRPLRIGAPAGCGRRRGARLVGERAPAADHGGAGGTGRAAESVRLVKTRARRFHGGRPDPAQRRAPPPHSRRRSPRRRSNRARSAPASASHPESSTSHPSSVSTRLAAACLAARRTATGSKNGQAAASEVRARPRTRAARRSRSGSARTRSGRARSSTVQGTRGSQGWWRPWQWSAPRPLHSRSWAQASTCCSAPSARGGKG